jgi:hypothetical protein
MCASRDMNEFPSVEPEHNTYFKLKFDDVSKVFELPIAQAALKLGVSESHLKRQCRILGIDRWPQRKLRSLLESMKQLDPENTIRRKHLQDKIDALYRQDTSKVKVVGVKKRGRPRKYNIQKVAETMSTNEQLIMSDEDVDSPFSCSSEYSTNSSDSEFNSSSLEYNAEISTMLKLDIEECTRLANSCCYSWDPHSFSWNADAFEATPAPILYVIML